MTVTADEARMLTALAISCRPIGAPRWDAAGVMAAIKRVAHLHLADVAHAVIRAAEDREARTPAVISATTSLHWRETNTDRPQPVEKVRAVELCDLCGKSELRHTSPDHEFVAQGEYLAHRTMPDPERHTAAAMKALAACETTTEETA